MASVLKSVKQLLLYKNYQRTFKRFHTPKYNKLTRGNGPMKVYHYFGILGGVTVIYTTYLIYSKNIFQDFYVFESSLNKEEETTNKLSAREKRFIKYASIKYNDELFMTPQDFLESVIGEEPCSKKEIRILNNDELKSMLLSIYFINKTKLFTDLKNMGTISYMEYLFLLSILRKPESGFKIAFEMLDTDENQSIGKSEFLIMEKIFNYKWIRKRNNNDFNKSVYNNTTLTVFFFGLEGDKKLTYDCFHKFIVNLQTEVLQLEFNKFSNNSSKISELDFARILLKHANLPTHQYEKYFQRILNRIENPIGITFEEFQSFNNFLNNIDDIGIVMRICKMTDHLISKADFQRTAKICTGNTLSEHLVDTVFDIFDIDGDGLLDYKEFLIVMKDRLHTGLTTSHEKYTWKSYQSCIRNEMKSSTFFGL